MKLNKMIENTIMITSLIIASFVLFTETGFDIALNIVSYCLRLIGLT